MEHTKRIINALMKPNSYPEKPKQIKLVQTAISCVFLTGKYVYKVKKPVNFGFLDFTTLDKRKHFCRQEVALNKRLAPEIYLGVVPITSDLRISGKGKIIDYAVKMLELPQERIMRNLLLNNEVSEKQIKDIARIIAEFHSKLSSSKDTDVYGSLSVIRKNWDENFEQVKDQHLYSKDKILEIRKAVNKFIKDKKDLFEKRVREGRIKRCHGDLHASNIFITDKIHIVDCIEFNRRFAYSDTASDVAFLAMDLDYLSFEELSRRFVDYYIHFSNDEELRSLIDFYKCYRAFVRAKINYFRINDPNTDPEELRSINNEMIKYFRLSYEYAKKL
ncbi:hypothetical protein D6745_02225 [Candidatus Woesearchaeota archaeon]|nr:MAG: hypothetical protein D6745_02225 [Candidatus Woesearchaeota archaeon]